MPRMIGGEPFVTEPDRAIGQHSAVLPLHDTLLHHRMLGDLPIGRLCPMALAKAGAFDGVPCTKESIQRRLIAQDPDDQTSGPSHHPTGDQQEVVYEPPKLHPNVGVSILLQVPSWQTTL